VKKITNMIAKGLRNYYMKEMVCRTCRYHKTTTLTPEYLRCPKCKNLLTFRWVDLGRKLDYSEYYTKKTAKRMNKGGAP
jgi:predicted nucleic-acid-binding Zn-ribbon protein